uniref:CRAL-TRIO domain-containing protein n=1 Tax=Salix viminalis TaxID=40686 RepID=A0A6N2LRE4_SALVM
MAQESTPLLVSPPPPPSLEQAPTSPAIVKDKEDLPPPPEPVEEAESPAAKGATLPPPPEGGQKDSRSSLAAVMGKEESVSSPKPPPEEKTEVTEKSAAAKEEVVAAADSGKEKQKLSILTSLALLHQKQEERQSVIVTQEAQTAQETPKTEASASDSDVSTEIKPPAETQESKVEVTPEKESHEVAKEEPKVASSPEEVTIWGIPLLKDDRSDVVLLKFLRARDFKVRDAFVMIKNTIQWRRDFKIDELVDEDLGDDLEKVVFMHGYDREGHPVCYNVYGEFQNKELYQKTFSDEEKRLKFLRWRIQFLERSIRKLDFSPSGISTVFQVNDLKNSPGPGKRELRLATKQALLLLQDNYPEFVAKQVFINVPWWYVAFYTMISPFMTQRTKSKFVFAGPSKSAETLFKYVSPEQVPTQYGGLSVDFCDCNPEFTIADPATVITVKPATKQTVEIILYEKCILVWELRVVGWEVSYSAEFVPDSKDAYTIIITKPAKMTPTSEPVVSSSFKVVELGKILLTIDNPTSKKKKLLYRFKIDSLSD